MDEELVDEKLDDEELELPEVIERLEEVIKLDVGLMDE